MALAKEQEKELDRKAKSLLSAQDEKLKAEQEALKKQEEKKKALESLKKVAENLPSRVSFSSLGGTAVSKSSLSSSSSSSKAGERIYGVKKCTGCY
jgi:flagellar capping protein FliD